MRFYYQVLGLASGETCPSLLLFFDNKRYLFNVGDGVQRLCSEHKVSLNKITDIFLTSLHPDSVGGLPGVMLTMMQASEQKRRIHGPPGLAAYMQGASWFMWNKSFDLLEYTDAEFEFEQYRQTTLREFRDENIRVKIIPLNVSSISVPIVHDHTFDFVPLDFYQSRAKPTSVGIPQTGVCYIVEGPKVPGSFLKDKAKELGVKGPMFSALSRGESVTIGDRVVTPADVQEPASPPVVFAVLHLTGSELLGSLDLLGSELLRYFGEDYKFCSIVHISPCSVLCDQRYVEFVRMMPRSVAHVVLNEAAASARLSQTPLSAAQGAAAVKSKLHAAFPSLFPLNQRFWSPTGSAEFSAVSSLWDLPLLSPEYFWKYNLSPARSRGPDASAVLRSAEAVESNPVAIPEVESDAPKYRDIVDTQQPGADPLIVFLGTGSMLPCKYRNVSGIYLGVEGCGLLLDCGEGSYSQLLLNFGFEATQALLRDLKAVIITHMHADHHLGLSRLIAERGKVTQEPLIVVAPLYLETYLMTMAMLSGPYAYTFVDIAGEVRIPGLQSAQMVAVDHVPHSYGIVLEHSSGWKFVYSGDTRPCQALVAAGLNATILVHEATFDDSLLDDAKQKHHSTMSEALEVAKAMNAWKVILTHFSQRYKAPPQRKDLDVILAADHLNLRFSDCEKAATLGPVLSSAFMEIMEPDAET